MKKLLFPFICCFVFISCKDKEVEICKAPDIQYNLAGVWDVTGTLFGKEVGPSQVQFTAEGDVQGADELLGEMGDARRIDWSVRDRNVLVSLDYGSNSTMELVLPVLENECREIRMGEDAVLYLELSRTPLPSQN